MKFNKALLFRRAIALYIDMAISSFVGCMINYCVFAITNVDNLIIAVIVMQLLMICRDIFGRSVGKQCVRLYVVGTEGHSQVKPYQRVLRNITTPIITIEFFVALLREDHRRFGDLLAKTEVLYKPNPSKGLLK